MNTPVLSVCIASFNKADMTCKLVESILKVDSLDLEVVVVDDQSTDDTVARLQNIKDPRFNLYVNSTNIGGAANTVKSVYYGNGIYSLFCNDRDIIYPEKLPAFMEFLKANKNLSCGFSVRTTIPNFGVYRIIDSKTALLQYAFRNSHPTGLFYNKNRLKTFPFDKINSDFQTMDHVPHLYENLLAEVCSEGKFAIYNEAVWASTGNTTHGKYVSGYSATDVDIREKWFHPENCLKRAKYNIEQAMRICVVKGLDFSKSETTLLLRNILVAETGIGVWRYRTIMTTPSLGYHYAVPTRHFGIFEALSTSYKLRRDYKTMLCDLKLIDKVSWQKVAMGGRLVDLVQCRSCLLSILSKIKHKIVG